MDLVRRCLSNTNPMGGTETNITGVRRAIEANAWLWYGIMI